MGQMVSNFFRPQDVFYGKHEVYTYLENLDASESEVPASEKVLDYQNLIPVDDFNKNHLPEQYREDEDVFKLAKSIATLTIRLKTYCVSKRRPNFVAGTYSEYPLFEMRGNMSMNSGTGRVCDVVKRTDGLCNCRQCKFSETPSKKWWSIRIFTSTHVVNNEEEAIDATCTLFYDGSQNSHERVVLVGCKTIWRCQELCLLETATCDEKLATNLFAEIKKFNMFWKSLKSKYKNNEEKEKFVIIASHPHGREKCISFGFGVDVGRESGLGYSKFIYTTPTCSGSCGAPVYVLGHDWFSTEYVHLGTLMAVESESRDSTIPEIYKKYHNYSSRWY